MGKFVKVAQVGDLKPGQTGLVQIGRQRIALYNVDGKFYATDDTCSHAEASLSEGAVEGDQIVCPLHGARFDVKTGAALCMPAFAPVDTYPVRVQGDDVEVDPDPR